jgi:hypothetical protein
MTSSTAIGDVGRIFLDANGTWFWGLSFEF